MNRELLNSNQRITVPVDLFGVHFPFHLEPTIYITASRLSADYRGGYWHFYRLDNGGFYMAPDGGQFRVSCPNCYDGTMSGDAFGLSTDRPDSLGVGGSKNARLLNSPGRVHRHSGLTIGGIASSLPLLPPPSGQSKSVNFR